MPCTRDSVSPWSSIVERIRAGSESAVEELFNSLRPIRLFLNRRIGPDGAEDAYQNVVVDLYAALKKGTLREPEALFAYALSIARAKVCGYIGEAVRERQMLNVERMVWLRSNDSDSPEQRVLRSERLEIATRILTTLPPRMREILIRFYLKEESEEQIRAAMGISHTQFRLVKSRAKVRYEQLVQQSMNRRPKREPTQSSPDTFDQIIV